MKLLKKLLPLVGIASAAAVIVPLGTSCASKKSIGFVDWNVDDGVYAPIVSQHEAPASAIYSDVATEMYFDAAIEDKNIFANDLAYYWLVDYSSQAVWTQERSIIFESMQVKVKDIVKTEAIYDPTITGVEGIPVYNVTFDVTCAGLELAYVGEYYQRWTRFDTTISYKNMPYYGWGSTIGSLNRYCNALLIDEIETILPSVTNVDDVTDWTIDITWNTSSSTISSTFDYDMWYDTDEDDQWYELLSTAIRFADFNHTWHSYYMANVTVADII